MTRSVLLVPPLIKYPSGPLLGPAMLAGAARAAGFDCQVVDLNLRWLHERLPPTASASDSGWVGDHDRPTGELRGLLRSFAQHLRGVLPAADPTLHEDPALSCTYDHRTLWLAAECLAAGAFGDWVERRLPDGARPAIIGVSVMYSGQVLAAMATTLRVRARWPRVPVVWGGPHVTTLQDRIAVDPAYGHAADGFVFGYAERTWVDLLDAVARGARWPSDVVRAGSGTVHRARGDTRVGPWFQGLDAFAGRRLTLPAQVCRGCAYGRCTYCTYPAIEGAYAAGAVDSVDATIELAASRPDTSVSFKDSLMVPPALRTLGERIAGRARWSATTKLTGFLADERQLAVLAAQGLSTLEVGLETLTPSLQLLVEKQQSSELYEHVLDACAAVGIGVVTNYIVGFPGADPEEERRWLDWVRGAIAARAPRLRAKVELNTFQLERLAPLARDWTRPQELEVVGEWPWATVLAWRWTGVRQ